MQTTMAIEDIKLTLPELVDCLEPGDEIVLTRHHQPVAKLVGELPKPPGAESSRAAPGLGKGMITYIAPDFDAPLEDIKEYME